MNFESTRLYIKKHSITGLLYFGKTYHKQFDISDVGMNNVITGKTNLEKYIICK